MRRERGADDHRRGAGCARGRDGRVARGERGRLQREQRCSAERDDARIEAVGVVAHDLRVQAAEEPEQCERGAGEEGARRLAVVRPEGECEDPERHVGVAEERGVGSHPAVAHRDATLQHPACSTRAKHAPGGGVAPAAAAGATTSPVRARCHRYTVPGWGVGELWLEDDRVVWSELPQPAAPGETPRPAHQLARRLAAFFAGEADDFADVELELDDGFYGDCARALRAVPRGEVVTYGELAALAGRPGAARAAGTFCARNRLAPVRPLPPRRRGRRDRLVRVARARLQAAAAGARACRSLTTCATSSRRSRRGGAAAARRAVGTVPRRRRMAPARPRRARGAPRPVEPGGGAARLRLLRDLGVRSEIRTYRRRAFDRATRYQLHVEVDPARRRGAPRGGRAVGARRAARAPAEARRRPLVLPRRLPARRPARRRHALRAAGRPARAARERAPTARACWPRSPHARRSRSRSPSVARHAIAYAKSIETIADLLALAGASETRAPSRRARRRRRHEIRGEPAGERRRGERQADGRRRPGSSSR